jgi:RimJ/RimL family protein N-acetyltransferase
MEPFTITTERLVLRPFRAEDVDEVLAYASDEAFARYVPGVPYPYGREHAEAFVSIAVEADWATDPLFAVELDGRVIGGINLMVDEVATAGLGYALGRAWWGRGLATEMARAVIDRAFGTYEVEVVWATADARNAASRHVMEKVGMRLDGILRQRRVHRGERVDECHYSVLRTEWQTPPA